MKEARYGVGSVLVEEGQPPTTVFIIVEGECRVIKRKFRPKPSGEADASGEVSSQRWSIGASWRPE